MQYYNPENREPFRWAIVAVVIYAIILAVLMLTIHFTTMVADTTQEGILVEFGESDFGQGAEELAATDVSATPPVPQELQEEVPLEHDDRQEIAIEQQQTEKKSPETTQVEQPQESRDTVIVEERVVNQQALFPGRNQQSSATSQGDSTDQGNQGAESGGESGVSQGGGDGNTAVATLKDRSVVGSLPKPNYGADASGKVIIDITVDDAGRVKSATYRAQGSTTNNSQLVAAAREAALKAQFTTSDNFIQAGTITYIFKMN
ncbi:MAG: hypothetical protein R3Y44_01375 [Rikenellaceae bacterium]